MKSNYKYFELIIRPKTSIKSRQWWISQLYNTKIELLKSLPKKLSKLCNKSSLTLLITNDKEIQSLNKKFRKINKSTDVLSFHLSKKEQEVKKYLGDIVISIISARKQAKEKKIALEKELQMLLVHGYLHLLGYDHRSKKEAKTMFSLQNNILSSISLK